ncbi:MAG: hypothetical protein GY866_06710 [Proteobacteria bacterium]|nr:hypothetical protein [Pseudomonadota bacterium]
MPENARSISIGKIENRSFVPRLDIFLRDLLSDRFAQNSIILNSPNVADLVLSFQINSTEFSRNDYSIDSDNGRQSFEFRFSVTGELTVLNVNRHSKYLNRLPTTGSYSLKTEDQDLTQAEIDQGRFKALEDLSRHIVSKLTLDF